MTDGEIGIGVIGLGFMGRIHVSAYSTTKLAGLNARLIAIADLNPASLAPKPLPRGNLAPATEHSLDLSQLHTFSAAADLLKDPAIHLVSICTPTDTHADLAIAALEAGKHVLLEKPVATTLADVHRIQAAAACSPCVIMPGMCMRFWPGWTWLKDRIDDRSLGRVLGVSFARMGAPPSWSPEFYLNPSRSGGALFDLHIHDTDFIYHCFGSPETVYSQGTPNHLCTTYRFNPARTTAPRVIAEGGWDPAPGFPFRMRYTAMFEHATADFDLSRTPQLMLAKDGHWQAVPIASGTAYEAQARYMVESVAAHSHGKPVKLRSTLSNAEAVTRILVAEQRSLQTSTVQSVESEAKA